MRPSLRNGDLAVALPAHGEVDPGRIVVCDTPVGAVVHRVARVVPGRNGQALCVLLGDANRRAAPFVVPAESVLGVVRVRLPGLGLPRLWLDQLRSALVGPR
mgnify:CR=1 FL=1